MTKSGATRLDLALVNRGLAETRTRAQALVLAGDVEVDGRRARRAGEQVGPEQEIRLRARPRFVSRGGEKLRHALDAFEVDPAGKVCADLGASTGGFSDCLLQAGAVRIYAVDVGYGQLDLRLREDPRVVVMERVNARYLEELPEPVDLVTIDVSFISLRLILPVARRLLVAGGVCVPLVKPQFEAGRSQVKKGVVTSPAVRRQVLEQVGKWAGEAGFAVRGMTRSPLKGPEGNAEFLMHLVVDGPATSDGDLAEMVAGVDAE
jgi:23S rRNA (cytidine1920-2'-O)/16S rRNA (cytidine1409-2'-O)-methyltransferase